ncbi:rhodanese-like domain-containing protein [Slackia heliotrinireducens]|uniref:rhodanese-like domain-containing protein n=1 Tax=Slackia heliotrinireducens TaxID=84110 RepID=UPI0033158AB6
MQISMADVEDLLNGDPHFILVDVRSREDFATGHIPSAGCMPVDEICDCLYDEALSERGLDAIANLKGMELADDASAIVLYGSDGEDSSKACIHMEAIGYANVYDAGSINDWGADLEVSPAPEHRHDHGDGCDCGCGHHH